MMEAAFIHGRDFVDARVDITGKRYTNCTFDGCVVYARPGWFSLESCEFSNCLFDGEGWPLTLVRQLLRGQKGKFNGWTIK